MEKLNFMEFTELVQNGESRAIPCSTVGYVLIEDDEGLEIFYAEWSYTGIETDECGEVTPEGWDRVARQDAENLPGMYEMYLNCSKEERT